MKIKFLHYNVAACRQYGNSPNGNTVSEKGTLEAIRAFDADIITLNEIDKNTQRSGNVDQPEYFSKSLGYNYFFAPAIELEGGHYGIAIFSRYKILSAEMVRIPDCFNGKGELLERRVIISAVLDANGRKLRVMMSHYGLTYTEQVKAVEYTLDELDKSDIPTVFSGDLNMTPNNPLIKKLSDRFRDSALLLDDIPITFPSYEGITPTEHSDKCANGIKIDYIFTYGAIEAQNVQVPDVRVSDHRPYYCELSF